LKKKSNTFKGEHTTVLGILFKKLNYKERRKSTDYVSLVNGSKPSESPATFIKAPLIKTAHACGSLHHDNKIIAKPFYR